MALRHLGIEPAHSLAARYLGGNHAISSLSHGNSSTSYPNFCPSNRFASKLGHIVAIPLAAAWRQFRWGAILTVLVLVECAVLAMNRGRCPLTYLASRYTEDRKDNFDIYLPIWLARRNKIIFGTLFVLGGLFLLGRWFVS